MVDAPWDILEKERLGAPDCGCVFCVKAHNKALILSQVLIEKSFLEVCDCDCDCDETCDGDCCDDE